MTRLRLKDVEVLTSGSAKGGKDMGVLQEPDSTARVLRIATATEVVFLVVSGFFLFTEHRAHYLGALPYGLAVVAVTAFFLLLIERRKHRVMSSSDGKSQPGKGAAFHA